MNMRLRRYFPLFGAVAFIAVCVFLGRSEKLTSYAGGAGCSGSGGVAQDLSALGTADDQSKASVKELARFPMAGPQVELKDDAATIARLEEALTRDFVASAPAAAEEFQEAGCYSPGSARVAELIGKIGVKNTITPTQRQIFVNVLLNTASFSASQVEQKTPEFQLKQESVPGSQLDLRAEIVANDRLVPTFEKIRAAISENNGVAVGDSIQELVEAETPTLNQEKLGQFNQEACAIKAFEAVAAITKFEVESPEKTAYRLLDALDALQPMDKGAYSLVDSLATVAPAIQPWDAHFLAIAMNKSFDDHTRGLACKNAATRGNDLSAITKIAADVVLPAQIADCLLTYTKEAPAAANAPATIGAGAASINFDARVNALRDTTLEVDQTRAITGLKNLFDQTHLVYFSNLGTLQGLTDNSLSLREQFAKADLVAQDFARLPQDSRDSFLEELSQLEAISPNHQHFSRHFRGLMARRTGAAVAAEDIAAIQRKEEKGQKNVVDQDLAPRDIDLDAAAQEMQKKQSPGTLNTLNPVRKTKRDDSRELKNGAPIPLPAGE
jgi:hypothetical protein